MRTRDLIVESVSGLSNKELVAAVPAVGAVRPHASRSRRYVFVNSMAVTDALREVGYVPCIAQQERARTRDPRFVRHAITFRHRSVLGRHVAQREEGVPQLVFINSHNGVRRAVFRLGYYRFVCMNGLMVGVDFAATAVRHVGHLPEEAVSAALDVAGAISPLMEQIDAWRKLKLTEARALSFARAAAVLRWGKEGAKAYDPQELLRVQREADSGNDLWHVLNRVQENATHGGFAGTNAAGRALRARALNGIGENAAFNTALWTLAGKIA